MAKKRCPYCNAVYFIGVEIGTPFRNCEFCGRVCIDTPHTNEWELQGTFGKTGLIISWVLKALFFGALLAGIIIFIVRYIPIPGLGYIVGFIPRFFYKFVDPITVSFLAVEAVVFGIIGAAIAAPILWRKNSKKIRDSKERMKNPEYRTQLRNAGLLNS